MFRQNPPGEVCGQFVATQSFDAPPQRQQHHTTMPLQVRHATLRAAALRVLEAHGTGQGLEAALRAVGAVGREGDAHG